MSLLKDISAVCQVSVPTVSKALNGRPDISDRTREKILEAAKALQYQTGGAERPVPRQDLSMNLGILMPRQTQKSAASVRTCGQLCADLREALILKSFWKTSMRAGFDLTFLNVDELAKGQMSYCARTAYRRLDGLCIMRRGEAMYDPQVLELLRTSLPIVTVDQVMDGHNAVLSDERQGMKELLYLLKEKHCGRIGLIAAHDMHAEYHMALFRRTMDEMDNPVREEWIRDAGDSEQKLERELQRMTQQPETPDCLVISGDLWIPQIWERTLRLLRAVDKKLPAALFGGIPSAFDGESPSRVMEDVYALGCAAARSLISSVLYPNREVGEQVKVPMIVAEGNGIWGLNIDGGKTARKGV